MIGSVVILPERPVARARLMIARPDLHEDGELLAACELLETFGDPVDVQRASLLKASLVARAVVDLNRRARVNAQQQALRTARAVAHRAALARRRRRRALTLWACTTAAVAAACFIPFF